MTQELLMKVHHMGIVVQDLPESIHFFKTLMGAETLAITQESRDTSNRMLRVGDELINLIQPRGTDSEIYDFLIQHGEGLHHLSIVVCD
jgi:catechol 2,3-dioxygenase-like lactoylglutathione lyase family enzyme